MSAHLERHADWCPAPVPRVLGPHTVYPYRCVCRGGTVELSDPRPEVVAAAVARYRERFRERYDG